MNLSLFCLCQINAVGKEWIGKSGHWEEERTRRDKDKISRTLDWVIFLWGDFQTVPSEILKIDRSL